MATSSSTAGGSSISKSRHTIEDSMNYHNQHLISILNRLKYLFENPVKNELMRMEAYKSLAELSKLMRTVFDDFSIANNKQLMIDSSVLIKAIKQYDYDRAPYSHDILDAINRLYDSYQNNFVRFFISDDVMSPTASMNISSATVSNSPNSIGNSGSAPGSMTPKMAPPSAQQQSQQQLPSSASSTPANVNAAAASSSPIGQSVLGATKQSVSASSTPGIVSVPSASSSSSNSSSSMVQLTHHSSVPYHSHAHQHPQQTSHFQPSQQQQFFPHHHQQQQQPVHFVNQQYQQQQQQQQQARFDSNNSSAQLQHSQQSSQLYTTHLPNTSGAGSTHSYEPEPAAVMPSKMDDLFDQKEESLLRYDRSITSLFEQAKNWSKYSRDVAKFFENRVSIEQDFMKSVHKNNNSFIRNYEDTELYPLKIVFEDFAKHEHENESKSNQSFKHFKGAIEDLRRHIGEYDKSISMFKSKWSEQEKKRSDCITAIQKTRSNFHAKSSEHQKQLDERNRNERGQVNRKYAQVEKSFLEARELLKTTIDEQNNFHMGHHVEKRRILSAVRNSLMILTSYLKCCTDMYYDTLRHCMVYDRDHIERHILKRVRDSEQQFDRSYYNYIDQYLQINSDHQDSKHLQNFDFSTDSAVTVNVHPKTVSQYKNYSSPNMVDSSVPKIFGVSLEALLSDEVPDIIVRCVKQIEECGTHNNGIYRVSGAKSKIDSLINDYETDPDSINWNELSSNVVANVLKCYFRELPIPLLTFKYYPDFIKIAKSYTSNHAENDVDIAASLRELVNKLPTVHYNTLRFLMRHLRKISHNCAVNSMPPSNLGIIFGPTLLKSNLDDVNEISKNTLYDTCHQTRVVELLILYANEIFDMADDYEEYENETPYRGMQNLSTQSEYAVMPKGLVKSATCSSVKNQLNLSSRKTADARKQFFNVTPNDPNSTPGIMFRGSVNPSKTTQGLIKYARELENTPMSPFSKIGDIQRRFTPMNNNNNNNNTSANNNNNNNSPLSRQKFVDYNKHMALLKSNTSGSFDSGAVVNVSSASIANRQRAVTPDKPLRRHPGELYSKANEMSRSSSSLYSSTKLSMINNEDLV